MMTIVENTALTHDIYRMRLAGDLSAFEAPGQFIDIRLEGHFLRRPISVCDIDYTDRYGREGVLTILYKVLGKGTEEMTIFENGRELDVLTGLGNGYDLDAAGERPLLIGGGVGIPPLYLAAKRLRDRDLPVTAILGFNTADDIFYDTDFMELGCDVVIATADGSAGIRGFVTDAFRETVTECGQACMEDADAEYGRFTHFYTCGPEPMLKAVFNEVYKEAGISGQMSFEERMGCGFGACMGCSIKTKNGNKRICKDGPVLRTEEIAW